MEVGTRVRHRLTPHGTPIRRGYRPLRHPTLLPTLYRLISRCSLIFQTKFLFLTSFVKPLQSTNFVLFFTLKLNVTKTQRTRTTRSLRDPRLFRSPFQVSVSRTNSTRSRVSERVFCTCRRLGPELSARGGRSPRKVAPPCSWVCTIRSSLGVRTLTSTVTFPVVT